MGAHKRKRGQTAELPSTLGNSDWKLAVIYSEAKNAIFFSVSSLLFIFRLFGVEKTIM